MLSFNTDELLISSAEEVLRVKTKTRYLNSLAFEDMLQLFPT